MPDENARPATKSELKAELATKTELREAITRLDKKIDRVAVEVVKTQGQMHQMEARNYAKMDTRFSQVLSAIDAFAKKSEIKGNAVVFHGRALTDVQVGLKDHESRLKTLESARP